ncbi:lactosylceramide 1,3-N-acetyl-beta-D-glucosaminyltransferase isoform X2 [Piliocolobus tephrosceles]|uniref:lactosylceramide 1,3-N-acetyl-beta-D-glucosaminyltransferase isoform X2 n=1 Tax=Piliocolobus tephrosceles TaxID=591936 RepID=UPI001301434F|nr:lactosylceramide 1,3-N-acetyl-beta-D-glucosaminyltransferase isoform X2 [Piliocolobus tephrosceles]XP_023043407.2 lactosylceramide 1,3-N-acetyl-beta-D-glucosaminyltransferase isoform X2 [Piliocolobus tephrosceles]
MGESSGRSAGYVSRPRMVRSPCRGPELGSLGLPRGLPALGLRAAPSAPPPPRRASSAERFAVSGAGGSEFAHSGPSEVSEGEKWLGGEDTLALAQRVAPGLQVQIPACTGIFTDPLIEDLHLKHL